MTNEILLQPLRFPCGIVTKNRIFLAPLTNTQSHEDGSLSELEYKWLKRRADGDFGLLITCATHVDSTGQGWPGELGVHSDRHIPGLARLSEMAHFHNARLVFQIFHGGARAPSALTTQQPVSASEFNQDLPGFEKPRALEENEILNLIQKFGEATARVTKAGADGVEIHGANGYLITQFLSSFSNARRDRWGGSFENRSRFLKMILTEVRKSAGPDKIVGVRLSPEDSPTLPGIDIDEMLALSTWLSENGADYIHLSLWEAQKLTKKYGAEKPTIVRLFRNSVRTNVPLITAGKIWTPAEAFKTMALGADAIALGAAAIANPDWPRAVASQGATYDPVRFPLSVKELLDRDVSEAFIEYLRKRNWVRL